MILSAAFSTIDFADDSLTLKNYDYNGNTYATALLIRKRLQKNSSVYEVIEETAESKLADTSVDTAQDSVSRLESSLNNLKTIKDAYTTGEDKMIEGYYKELWHRK